MVSIKMSDITQDKFDWKYYLEQNPDLPKNINTQRKAYYHWQKFGQKNGRPYHKTPELVTYDYCICITTYNRPEMLDQLLTNIYTQSNNNKILVNIFNDASTKNYSQVKTKYPVHWVDYKTNHGKKKFWKIWDDMVKYCKNISADYFIFLPDDIELYDNFFDNAKQMYEDIQDDHKICLSLFLDDGRKNSTCWTKFKPIDCGSVLKTQWMDGLFICKYQFFQKLNFKIEPVPETRWKQNPSLGSGVGQQLSVRLFKLKLNMYHTKHSLVEHGKHDSQMNYNLRKYEPLTNSKMIVASLTTIPERIKSLEKVVESLLISCDKVNVFLNNFEDVPSFLQHEKITIARSQDHGDMGDGNKFFWVDKISNCYHFICDDDLYYKPTYFKKSIETLKRYDNKVIVSWLGSYFPSYDVFKSYYKSRKSYHMSIQIPHDLFCNIIGSGAMAFYSNIFPLTMSDIKHPNMGDVWAALKAKQLNIPMLRIGKDAPIDNYIVHLDHLYNVNKTIWANSNGHNNNKSMNTSNIQTQTAKDNYPWHLNVFNDGNTFTLQQHVFTYNGKSLTFYSYTNDHIFKYIKANTFYEANLLVKIQKLNLKGTYVDVGANIGNHSVFFLNYCACNKVISIEGHPKIFELLKVNMYRNTTRYNDFSLNNLLIGDVDDFKKIEIVDESNLGMSRISDSGKLMKMTTLDKIITTPISLLKIDVENYEYQVLKGASNLIEKYHPLIIIELQCDNPYYKEIIAFLKSHDYVTDGINYGKSPTYIYSVN